MLRATGPVAMAHARSRGCGARKCPPACANCRGRRWRPAPTCAGAGWPARWDALSQLRDRRSRASGNPAPPLARGRAACTMGRPIPTPRPSFPRQREPSPPLARGRRHPRSPGVPPWTPAGAGVTYTRRSVVPAPAGTQPPRARAWAACTVGRPTRWGCDGSSPRLCVLYFSQQLHPMRTRYSG